MKVLLVEDDFDVAYLMSHYFEHWGYDSIVYRNPSDIDYQKAATCDVAIIDYMLPGTSGLDVARQLGTVSDMPVIFFTASHPRGLPKEVRDYGPTILKPIDPERLHELIANITEPWRALDN